MNIKSPLPGNDVGYKKEESSMCVCVCGCVVREKVQMKVQMKVQETKAKVCRDTHLSTFWDVGDTPSPAPKNQVNQTKQLVIIWRLLRCWARNKHAHTHKDA